MAQIDRKIWYRIINMSASPFCLSKRFKCKNMSQAVQAWTSFMLLPISKADVIIFQYFIKSVLLCQELFYFSFLSHPLSFRSASSDSLYRLSHLKGFVNNFFAFLFPGRSASASPAELVCCAVASPSSATGAILSLLAVIVNVFLVFYLFQTIHTFHLVSSILIQ